MTGFVQLRRLATTAAAAGLAAALASAAAAESVKIKVGVSTPPGYSYNVALEEFKRLVEGDTGGDVSVTIFPSAQLGGEIEMGKNVQLGILEMTSISTSNISPFHKPFQVLSVPYLLKNQACGLQVVDGAIGDDLAGALLQKAGIRVLGWYTFGMRQLFNTKRDVVKLEDLKGLKIRIPADKYLELTWRTLGAQPIPLPFPEVFSALQQGVIDGDANPTSSIQRFKWYEVVKHVSYANVAVGISPLMINDRLFQKMTPEQREILQKAATVSVGVNREAHDKDTVTAEEWLKTEGGVKFVQPDLAEFRAAMQPVWDAAREEFGTDLVDSILKAQDGC